MPEAEVDIETIAAGGDGVGRIEAGLVTFVPRTAPGDRARIRYAAGRRFARGELERLVRASPVRIAPRCSHYVGDRCGGCTLQHLAYEAQLEAKARIVRDALVRIGHRQVPLPEIVPSPRPWGYRSKLTLAMRRREGRWIAGLHPYDDAEAVFALRECPITEEPVLAVWRAILAAGEWLPAVDALRGAVRVVDGSATFVLEGARQWDTHAQFFAAVAGIGELWWTPEDGAPRALHRRGLAALGMSFAQVNTALAGALENDVIERARRYAPARVVDAYAGRGHVAIALAQTARVTAIESDARAVAWCRERLAEAGGSRAIAGRVEDVIADALPADVVVLNPPRAGVHERVTTALAGPDGPRAIIYVSCDPATLARDVKRLEPYAITAVRAFDMFPQTAHVETVVEMSR